MRAEGWKWVDVRARYGRNEYTGHTELRKTRREPTKQEATASAAPFLSAETGNRVITLRRNCLCRAPELVGMAPCRRSSRRSSRQL